MAARILLVEDDPNLRRILQVKLSRAGFTVSTAGDARSALEDAQREPPDVLVADYRLPDATAVEVVEGVRGIASAPVVLITAYEDPSTQLDIARIGPISVLYKPFDLDQLVDRARAAYSARHELAPITAREGYSNAGQDGERRQSARRIWVTDAVVAARGVDPVRVATRDIGTGGIGLVGQISLERGERVTVEWSAGSAAPLRAEGRVAHCEPLWANFTSQACRLGIAFESVPAPASAVNSGEDR
jgi:CheY-like chemotaxis protein